MFIGGKHHIHHIMPLQLAINLPTGFTGADVEKHGTHPSTGDMQELVEAFLNHLSRGDAWL